MSTTITQQVEETEQEMPVIVARLATGFYDSIQFKQAAHARLRACETQQEYDEAVSFLRTLGRERPLHRTRCAQRRQVQHLVYAIEALGLNTIKIGWTQHLKSRLSAIRTSCPVEVRLLGVTPGNRTDEVAMHQQFEDCRVRGEWFRATPELRAEVSTWKV
jgi:hypothetical protein